MHVFHVTAWYEVLLNPHYVINNAGFFLLSQIFIER